ncbi:MAG: 2-oxoisovalerate dehydrogenase [Cyclobacteriaceae bacterium]|nr:2-oxoisovalerate dehydrogenase [Cyclobacteriaceae bacterium]
MEEIKFIIQPSAEGGFEARALEYSIFTEGETLEEVKENISEAIKCHFEDSEAPTIISIQ